MLNFLLKIKEQIKSPANWTRDYLCRDIFEIPAACVCQPNIRKWSLVGATELHTWEAGESLETTRAVKELLRSCGGLWPRTHSETMEVLNRAIKKAQTP